MLSERMHTFEKHDVASAVCQGKPYFRAADITTILGYKNSAKAIRTHVSGKYIKTLFELNEEASSTIKANVPKWNIQQNQSGKSPLYINESGVYELVFQSIKPEAVRFREWIVEDILPEIRKTGRYVRYEQVSLMNETDLHYKVVDFIRKFFAEAILVPGLGELQDTEAKRLDAWNKGYKAGQPDIIILNHTRKASGLAIELKTPLGSGTNSVKQDAFQQNLRNNKYEIFLSNSYDEIVVRILEYREAVRRCIPKRKARSSVE
jgi:prophage antirepressor-like protein